MLKLEVLCSNGLWTHGLLEAFPVVLKGGAQASQDFGGCLKEGLGFGFGYLIEIFAQMVNHIGQHPLDVFRVNTGVVGIFRTSFHLFLPWFERPFRAALDQTSCKLFRVSRMRSPQVVQDLGVNCGNS